MSGNTHPGNTHTHTHTQNTHTKTPKKHKHPTYKTKNKNKLSIASWSKLNPTHALLLYDDADLAAYFAAYFPALGATFDALEMAVEKSDFWRYMVCLSAVRCVCC